MRCPICRSRTKMVRGEDQEIADRVKYLRRRECRQLAKDSSGKPIPCLNEAGDGPFRFTTFETCVGVGRPAAAVTNGG